MSAAHYDMEIEKGTTFKYTLSYTDSTNNPINLTGYTAKMQIREQYISSEILAELSSANGKITINGTQGKILLNVPAHETDDYIWMSGVYDLVIISSGGEVTRLLEGGVSVSQNVTEP